MNDETVAERLWRISEMLRWLTDPWRADVQWLLDVASASGESTKNQSVEAPASGNG